MLGGRERDGTRAYHAAQDSAQFQMGKLFISGILPFSIFGSQLTRVTETTEGDTVDGELLDDRGFYAFFFFYQGLPSRKTILPEPNLLGFYQSLTKLR